MRHLSQRLKYPFARRDESCDTYHGVLVADPYQWLENNDDQAAVAWTKAQQQLTQNMLTSLPFRDQIHRRLTTLWNFVDRSVPQKKNGRYFFQHRTHVQDMPILYAQLTLNDEPLKIFDPVDVQIDSSIEITYQALSADAALMAYCLSTSTSETQEIHVRNLLLGNEYEEIITASHITSIIWKHDNSGFYYSCLTVSEDTFAEEISERYQVYWHSLNTSPDQDRLIYEQSDTHNSYISLHMAQDGLYLVIDLWDEKSATNQMVYCEITRDDVFMPLCGDKPAHYEYIDTVSTVFYIMADYDSSGGRIIAIDVARADSPSWRDVLPTQEQSLVLAALADSCVLAVYARCAQHVVQIHALDGTWQRTLDLPPHHAVTELASGYGDNEIFLKIESFLQPPTIMRYDIASDSSSIIFQPIIDFDFARYETSQIFYQSRDGTRISMFLTHHKGLTLDGTHPVLLTGYGGFGVPMLPTFGPAWLMWLECGGVYAVANVRGGSEYGKVWHQAGMSAQKQNTFDDFIAATEWLIANHYTQPSLAGIIGSSNGGLLVAACLTQRPELFGAVICQAPMIDMLRYHRLTIGSSWLSEYGDPDNPEHFQFLHAYSPLHTIRAGVTYPPVLVTTSDADDRVASAHAKKFIATLQYADSGVQPLLLRVDDVGHGWDKPLAQLIEELCDVYSFLLSALGQVDILTPLFHDQE
jgi:prolyl oligopeptidase